ncbi:Parvulin-like peptidyl-prolyl isomerase [Ignavibacterium album JCM 16511]|uniref:Periplasmic chaperone PpiD n=2 Tax=Ignavibacterium album TaxID=591197 RepID=I0AM39_IGNAJ|nr:Parvulin-like peptidyl-prolyl isomerase [Ignavibacterium album JCM 16511]
MPMMERMRSLAPAFIITVGALFVLFMVISDSNVLEALGGKTNYIGKVNGKEITYQEFQTALDRQLENLKQQTGQDIDESQMDQIREQVWESIVNQVLIEQAVQKFGITVSDEEIKEIILGENPPDFLKQNFVDSLGNFNRQLYEQALFDPRNKEALVQAEEFVRQQRLTQKLQSYLLAGIVVTEDEVKQKFIDQNISMEADYVLFDVNSVPESEIQVTDADLKSYFDKNINLYKQPPQRKLQFVLFPNVPSADDTNLVLKNLQNILRKIKEEGADFKEMVDIYSEIPYSRDTLSVQYFTPEALKLISSANPGDVIGPVAAPQGFTIYKFFGKVPSTETFARASHILINQKGSDEKNLEEANKIYQRLIAGEDFGKLAKEFSADPGSGKNGGDLGFFTKGMMVKEFEDAVFNGKVGEIQKPVKTSYGYHIIKVTDRINYKFVVERLSMQVKQSATTKDRIYNQANDFSFLANKNGFESEAKLMGYEIRETPLFSEQSVSVPAIGPNKQLVKYSFENSVNTVSPPFKTPSGYVVVRIAEALGERFTPFDEVKVSMKPAVIREKKFEKLEKTAKEVYSKAGGDIYKIPQIRPDLTIQQTGPFTAQGTIPNLGRDYAFINKAQSLEVGKTTEPFKGMRGYYIMRLTKKTPFDKDTYSAQAATIKMQLLNEKKARFINEWLEQMKKDAKIVDNRFMFFGY